MTAQKSMNPKQRVAVHAANLVEADVLVILTDQEQAVTMWQALLDNGLYVNMARPPATPAGTFLLRCSLCAEHTPEQIQRVLGMFKAAGQAVGVIA